jgi:signal transduction histidine kinase
LYYYFAIAFIKSHGGEIKVESKEGRPDDQVGRGEGTEFIILLPVAGKDYAD